MLIKFYQNFDKISGGRAGGRPGGRAQNVDKMLSKCWYNFIKILIKFYQNVDRFINMSLKCIETSINVYKYWSIYHNFDKFVKTLIKFYQNFDNCIKILIKFYQSFDKILCVFGTVIEMLVKCIEISIHLINISIIVSKFWQLYQKHIKFYQNFDKILSKFW